MTNTGGMAGTLISVTSLSGTLLFNGKSLWNANSFSPGAVVYSGATLPETSSGILALMTALQTAYSGSDITSVQHIATLLATSTGTLVSLGTNVLNGQLGGSANVTASITPNTGNGSGPSNPTALSLTHATGSKTFSFSWTAGSGNG
jgi:hypothetical protein